MFIIGMCVNELLNADKQKHPSVPSVTKTAACLTFNSNSFGKSLVLQEKSLQFLSLYHVKI